MMRWKLGAWVLPMALALSAGAPAAAPAAAGAPAEAGAAGSLRHFVSAPPGSVMIRDDVRAAPEARATAFLRRFGEALGLSAAERGAVGSGPGAPLRVETVIRDPGRGAHVILQQVWRGLDVAGGRLSVHMSPAGITGASGLFVPGIALDTRPALTARSAAEAAVRAVGIPSARPGSPRLGVYRSGLVRDVAGRTSLAYAVDVRGPGTGERVWVDARSGLILDRLPLVLTGRDRLAFAGAAVDPLALRKEGDPAGPLAPINNIFDFTGDAYDFFRAAFDRDSYDGAGATMRTVYGSPGLCPNAWWDGKTTNFCPGFDLDDVVAHEWGHGYTDYTSRLVYECEPGALNESYSDVWGETVDLINGVDGLGGSKNDVPKSRGGVRWILAEDLSARLGGAIRDMWSPGRYGQPSKASDIANRCAEVHKNSGVPNHAYALLVDGTGLWLLGGQYNGHAVSGIGLTKAVNIYWLTAAAYEHANTLFSEHALALSAACDALVGASLRDIVTGGPSSEQVTADDCLQVSEATAAVELDRWAGSVVSGTVTDSYTSSPLPGVCVRAYSDATTVVSSAPTAQDGSYRLVELAPGTYKVEFSPCDTSAYDPQWYQGKTTFETADSLVISGSSERISGIDAALHPVGPADLAVTGLSVEDDPIAPALRHTVSVDLSNLSSSSFARNARIDIEVCPVTAGLCQGAGTTATVPPGGAARADLIWLTVGWAGDAIVTATAVAEGDPDATNDSLTVRHQILVDAGGAGVSGVSLFQ
ncbi:MAG: M4 family metallopeptidase [Acidobacteria bacterium]|nr:M4 family metallopeptidase [Acidobacteriota bacterium]